MEDALKFALQVIDMMPAVSKGVVGAVDAFNAGKAVVEAMVREGRAPTTEEWDRINADTAMLRTALHTD